MKSFLLSFLLLTAIAAHAQMPYTVVVLSSQAYQPLATGATSVNGTQLWTPSTNYVIPLPFPFAIGNQPLTSTIALSYGGTLVTPDTMGFESGFLLSQAHLTDRAHATGPVSQSPIRYRTDGSSPYRVFKLEVGNAGFDDEILYYGTLRDSVSYQLWLYENGVAEFHFGPSHITHASDYFRLDYSNDTNLVAGYTYNWDFTSHQQQQIYFLKGSAASPVIDSEDANGYTNSGLHPYPPSGTILRFLSKTLGVPTVQGAGDGIRIYPVPCSDALQIDVAAQDKTIYKITGADGRQVAGFAGVLSPGHQRIETGALPLGLYFLQVQNAAGTHSYRFTKI